MDHTWEELHKMPVKKLRQIAEELGFNDAVAFSHAFKHWAGAAPRPWRQLRRLRGPAG